MGSIVGHGSFDTSPTLILGVKLPQSALLMKSRDVQCE